MGTSFWCAAGIMMNDRGIFKIACYDLGLPVAGKCLEDFQSAGWRGTDDDEKLRTARFIVNKILKAKGLD